jgi:predicted nucleotidyltransferase component of viral defense system
MTVNVKKAIEKIYYNEIFNDELYFCGGTALAYYLNHRISEDIDIVSGSSLNHRKIIPNMSILGAKKLQDENVTALRMAGLFADEYMIKFVLDDVKLEFFQANRLIQKEILKNATVTNFENSKLKILDLKSIAKLKIVALLMRDKSRDLFDFGAILENKIFNQDELIELFNKIDDKISSLDNIIDFIKSKEEPQDDEAVYLNENNRMDLSFEEIKSQVIGICIKHDEYSI